MNDRLWLGWILGLYGILGLGFSLLVPMWEAPDEQAHYEVALYIARHSELI